VTMTIELPAAVETWLADQAARRGTTPSVEAAAVLAQAAGLMFDEILTPFRRSIAETDLSDEELNDLVHEVRQEIWDERHCDDMGGGRP